METTSEPTEQEKREAIESKEQILALLRDFHDNYDPSDTLILARIRHAKDDPDPRAMDQKTVIQGPTMPLLTIISDVFKHVGTPVGIFAIMHRNGAFDRDVSEQITKNYSTPK